MAKTTSFTLFVGLDIASTSLMAARATSPGLQERPVDFAQDTDRYAAMLEHLAATGTAPADTLVVMEATSSYWVPGAVTRYEADDTVSTLNPAQLHTYVKSLPRRSRTDALDAQALFQFAMQRMPRTWTPPPAVCHELRQRLMARDALVDMRQPASCIAVPAYTGRQRAGPIVSIIADLDGRIAALDSEIGLLLQHGAWSESASLLQSIPGIGPATAAWHHCFMSPGSVCVDDPGLAVAVMQGRARRCAWRRSVLAARSGDSRVSRPTPCRRETSEGRSLCSCAQVMTPGVGSGQEQTTIRSRVQDEACVCPSLTLA